MLADAGEVLELAGLRAAVEALGVAGRGAGTRLRWMGEEGRLAVKPDSARGIALRSVFGRRPVAAEVLRPIEAAAAYWAAGDKALANLRLVFSGLPKLRSATDAACLEAAAWCLDQGLAPRDLMKALDLDPSVLDLRKYDPDQPRVPAGSGRESGRWTSDADTVATPEWSHDDGPRRPSASAETDQRPLVKPSIVLIADEGPLRPGGITIVPHADVDPLDPSGFNTPLSSAEQQAMADTVDAILKGNAADLPTLNPQAYNNRPDDLTGAVLPPPTGGYTTYYVRPTGAPPGVQRIIMDNGVIYFIQIITICASFLSM